MQKIFVSIFFVIFLVFVSLVTFNFYSKISNTKFSIVSPVPDFLTVFLNRQVSTLNLWAPSVENKVKTKLEAPIVSARSGLIYDLTSKQVLYSKNPKERLPMASLTKIMTAVVALENEKKDDQYKVTKDDLVGEDTMGLDAGETLSLNDLLYGLILNSGNDAGETLATNFTKGRSIFIKTMNSKVKTLGLSDTNFTNPTGLEGDGNQYTTAYDLVVMTQFALSNFPLFGKIASTFDYNIPYSSSHKVFYLENETNLLTSYPGVKGIKTGYTPEAGLCLVTYLDYDGHKIIAVILGSDDRRGEMIELLDYSLQTLGITPPQHG